MGHLGNYRLADDFPKRTGSPNPLPLVSAWLKPIRAGFVAAALRHLAAVGGVPAASALAERPGRGGAAWRGGTLSAPSPPYAVCNNPCTLLGALAISLSTPLSLLGVWRQPARLE